MKYKIHSMIFSDAGYSFSFMRMYYEHVVALFNQSTERAREIRGRIEAEYREKGKEYNKQHMEGFHRVFDEVYPRYFHNSFLVSSCSLFEYQVKKVWAFIQEEHELTEEWDGKRGTIPQKTRRFLRIAGVILRSDPPRVVLRPPDFKPKVERDDSRVVISALWRELDNLYIVRNCIIHDNGQTQKAKNRERLEGYAAGKGVLANREGQLNVQLNEDFNKAACDTMGTFFSKLESAYYGTPLPQDPDPSDSSS